MATGWIVADNLQLYLDLLAEFVGYPLDEGDRDAVRFGIQDTDAEQSRWYDYPLLACDEAHLAVCPECREVQRTFQGRRWTELVEGQKRPPASYAGPCFLRPEAQSYFLPAYLVAALRDNDPEWLNLVTGAAVSENNFTPLQREVIAFVTYILNRQKQP